MTTTKTFESREEANAWLLALPAAVQMAGVSRKDDEGFRAAVLRHADILVTEWRARGGNSPDW